MRHVEAKRPLGPWQGRSAHYSRRPYRTGKRHNKHKPRTTIGVGTMPGKFFAVAAAAALGCLLPILAAVAPAGAADFVLKFGTATINETQHQFIKFYKDELEKNSGARIELQEYPASQLPPIPAELQGGQLGTREGYIGSVYFFVGVDPRFGVFPPPILFRDDANAVSTV